MLETPPTVPVLGFRSRSFRYVPLGTRTACRHVPFDTFGHKTVNDTKYCKPSSFLSIIQKLDSDHDSECNVVECRQTSPDDGIDKCWIMSSVTVVSTLTHFNSGGLNLTRTCADIRIRSRSNLRKEAPVETP